MPTGTYRVLDASGAEIGTESFRCAHGPVGWRYFATVTTTHGEQRMIDLSVDAAWRPVRARAETPAHAVLLIARGGRLIGEHDGEPVDRAWDGGWLAYPSPGYDAAAANAFPDGGEVSGLGIDPDTLEPRPCRLLFEPIGQREVLTAAGRFTARGIRRIDADSGTERIVWVAGDVCVAADGYLLGEAYDPGARGPVPVR